MTRLITLYILKPNRPHCIYIWVDNGDNCCVRVDLILIVIY